MGVVPSVVEPTSLSEAVLAVQAKALELDLRRDGEAEKGSARFRRYLEYPKLLKELQPLLTANRLTWQTFPTIEDGKPAMLYRLRFVPTGEVDEGTMLLMLDKQTSQAQGSGLTYAKRYSLQAVLNLTPDGDDDGDAASTPVARVVQDPEAEVSEEYMNAMREAVAERGLSLPRVLERAGWAGGDGAVVTYAHGKAVKELLDAHDAAKGDGS